MSIHPSRRNCRADFLCMMALLCVSGLLAPFAGATVSPEKTLPLYSVSILSDQLATLDPLTDTVLTTVSITVSGGTVNSANGMAQDPVSGKLFVILALAGQSGRELLHRTAHPGKNPTPGRVHRTLR
jgi:hypothetical protein